MSEVESLLQLHLREKTSVYAGTGRWESLRVVQQASSLRRVEPLTQKSYLGCFLETGIANQGFGLRDEVHPCIVSNFRVNNYVPYWIPQ